MIGEILGRVVADLVFDGVSWVVRAMVEPLLEAPRARAAPRSGPRRARASGPSDYAGWIEEKGLVDAGRDLRGRLAGAEVSLDLGFRGSSPAAVEILLSLARDVPEPVLVTRAYDNVPPDLAPLFERLGDDLASIGCTSTTLRLRLVPLVAPEALDAAWQELEALVLARPRPDAYR